MTNAHTDFLFYAGATWAIDASLHDADGAPLDLTGCEVAWRLFDRGGSMRIELTVGTGVTVTDPINGLCHIEVPPEQTAKVSPGPYRDEIRVTLATGFVCVQAVGAINVALAGASAAPVDPAGQLAALKAARYAGKRRVRIENFEVEYGSDAEMAAAIRSLEAELAAAAGVAPVRNVLVRSKGWS